ncbi:MAG TPA: outer membrane protein transport protein, partial [bacterium]|nr:outer membrane protein transport protein [bacterium]
MARYFWRWLVLVFWASLSLAGAQGMRNPPEGNAALGQAGAFIAQCDDPSAITHNPAGLIQITGTEWLAGVNTILSNTWYRSDLFSDKKDFSPIMLPYVFLSSDLGKEKFRVGVGVTIPFGQSTEWSQETVRKWNYASPYYAGLQTADVITAGCWKLSPELSLGVALHVYSSRLAINNLLPFPVESEAKIRVTGYAAAPALGLLYRQSRYSFGLTYKAKFSIDYDGKLRWLNFGELPAEATINFPALAGAGFAFRPTPSWKIET